MLLKYYNCIMNLNSEKTIIEAWDIYCKEEDEDNAIDETVDSFRADLQNVLCSIIDLDIQYHFIWSCFCIVNVCSMITQLRDNAKR